MSHRTHYPLHTFTDSQLRAAEARAPGWSLSPLERRTVAPAMPSRRPMARYNPEPRARVAWGRVLAVAALLIAGALALGI